MKDFLKRTSPSWLRDEKNQKNETPLFVDEFVPARPLVSDDYLFAIMPLGGHAI